MGLLLGLPLAAGLALSACGPATDTPKGGSGEASSAGATAGGAPEAEPRLAEGGGAKLTASDAGHAASMEGGSGQAHGNAPVDHGPLDRLDTGVDLTKVNVGGGTAPTPAAYDPVRDANLPPGHFSLVEGEAQEHDFGTMRQGEKGQHTFRMVSDGENPLVITRLKPSCGCTVAEVALIRAEGQREVYRTGDEIAPNTSFELLAELNTEGKSGHVSSSIAVYSNDLRPVFNLGLKAEVKPMLEILPQATLNLGTLTTIDSAEGKVQVTSEALPPYKLSLDPRLLEEQPVVVTLEPVEPDAEGRSRTWDVTIKIGPNFTREGISSFPVLLNTDQEIENPKNPNPDGTPVYHQAGIYPQATITAMVTAEPQFLPIGMIAPGETLERTVRISCLDDFPLSEDVQVVLEGYRRAPFPYADFFRTRLEKVEGENALDLHVDLLGLPEEASGSFGGILRVPVGHPHKQEVEVRFSGLCRAGITKSTPAVGNPPANGGATDGDGHDH